MKILAAIAVIVVVGVVVVATRPPEFRIARTTRISAPPLAVFTQVSDFHKWGAWNPWATLDPAMKQGYEGAPAGAGAVYTWAGNSQVGAGRMTMMESRPSELIMAKAIHLVMNMDTMIGQFDKGLAQLKSVVEAAPRV